jgi:hypothetical protein
MKKIIQILGLMFLSGIAQADIYSDAEASMNEKESVLKNYFPSHQQTIIPHHGSIDIIRKQIIIKASI